LEIFHQPLEAILSTEPVVAERVEFAESRLRCEPAGICCWIGTLELLRHGRQTDTTFESGATFQLGDRHEKLSGFTAANGVTLEVLSGGTLIDDTISSGGSLVINGRVDVRGTAAAS
jgi:autotransporter passenger strand-loop-strand repeat protein